MDKPKTPEMPGTPFPELKKQIPSKPPEDLKKIIADLGEQGIKLRLLEERYSNMRRKGQLSEQNLIRIEKDVNDEIRTINEEINDLKKDVHKLKSKFEILNGKMTDFASDEELKVLAKYIDLINPTHYITREDAMKIIDEVQQKSI